MSILFVLLVLLGSCAVTAQQQDGHRRLRYSEHDKKRAEKACEKVDEQMRTFCIDDVLQTGDVTMAHGYGMSF